MQRALSTLLPIVFVLFAASHAYAQYPVTASWDANSDPYTAGYRVYYGTASGTYQWSVDVGSQTSAPMNLSTGNYFFAVRAYNGSYEYGPQSSEVTVTVGDSGNGGGGGGSTTAPTATINATLESPTWAIVTWSTNNATSATINGNAVGASGSAGMPVSGPTTFTIVARNTAGQTATANVTVGGTSGGGGGGSGPAPTAAINASLDSPTTAFVTWTTTNATSATLNGSAIPVNGSVKLPISGTTTYTIVASNNSGQTATANVTVGSGGGGGGGSTTAPTATINATLESPTWAIVTWSTNNATSATINGNAVGASGTAGIAVSGPTTFTIVARNTAGQTATANVTVGGSGGGGGGGGSTAPTATINATLESPTWAIVTWSTNNATSATINGNAVGASGTAGIAVSGPTTFTIVALNTAGQTATANVTVGGSGGGGGGSGPVPTAAINASLDSPTTAFVTWTTTNATSATLNGSAIPVNGSVKLPISGTATYTIVASNNAGQTATANVTVGGTGGGTTPPPTAWIGASLDSSNTAFVAWSSSNASSVTINGGPVAPSGSVKIPIYVTTTYTIVVTDAAGRTATSAATVMVQ
ncbi:MAG TPA: hypothetical protein VL263_02905 [Vicinamibacterales bacterium]|nr:hypothetical protein [Vicinamibacterales bacterium]